MKLNSMGQILHILDNKCKFSSGCFLCAILGAK